jgi:hypothetical protein
VIRREPPSKDNLIPVPPVGSLIITELTAIPPRLDADIDSPPTKIVFPSAYMLLKYPSLHLLLVAPIS